MLQSMGSQSHEKGTTERLKGTNSKIPALNPLLPPAIQGSGHSGPQWARKKRRERMKSERKEFAARLFPRHPPSPHPSPPVSSFQRPASRSNWDVSELSLLFPRIPPRSSWSPPRGSFLTTGPPAWGRLPTPRGPAGEPRPQSGGVVSAAALHASALPRPSPSRGS